MAMSNMQFLLIPLEGAALFESGKNKKKKTKKEMPSFRVELKTSTLQYLDTSLDWG